MVESSQLYGRVHFTMKADTLGSELEAQHLIGELMKLPALAQATDNDTLKYHAQRLAYLLALTKSIRFDRDWEQYEEIVALEAFWDAYATDRSALDAIWTAYVDLAYVVTNAWLDARISRSNAATRAPEELRPDSELTAEQRNDPN